MSLSSTTSRNGYTGNGNVDTYSYTFRIFDEDDLVVTVRDTAGVETTLTKTTHYTVSGVGDVGGGSVALVAGAFDWLDAGNDLESGYILTIRRVVGLTQVTDIRNQGDFYPEVHEDQFDKLTMIDQQQQDELDRSITLPETVSGADFDPSLPGDILDSADKVPLVNATGDGFADAADWPTATAINGAAASAAAASASATDASQHATTAQRWAKETASTVVDADTGVDSLEYSAKAYAIGGTGVTSTSGKGAAKEWATTTGAAVDTSEYSAKEYAQGSTVSTGSAKDWAQKTSAAVTGALYSAKEWALGVLTRGLASGGSAKDWATYTGGTVDNAEYSAKYYAQAAAASASAAQWDDVSFKVFADSPITIVDGDAGTLFSVDCTGGNIVINLPSIAALTLSNPWSIGFKKTDSSSNTLTINRNGADTFDGGGTSVVISVRNSGVIIVPDTDSAPDQWTRINFGDLQNLNSPTITTPTIDVITLDGQASSPSNPAAGYYKVYIKDDGRAYMLNSAGLEAGLGGGGGGGSLKFLERANSPYLSVENNLEVYIFGAGLAQELYAAIRVPQSYAAGSQINMRGLIYNADTSGNILVRTQTTLIRSEVDEVTSTTNQRTSTNSAITMSAANDQEPQKVVWDLTSSTGQINAVSVSAGDLIVVRLYRDTDTATSEVKFIQLATEVSFS